MNPSLKYNLSGLMLALILLGFAGGCSNDLEDPGTLTDVQRTFELDFFEELEEEQRRLTLTAATIEEMECLNYSINYTFAKQNNRLEISLNDIEAPADCLPGQGPAQQEILLGDFDNGVYQLFVELKNTVKNEGRLFVSDQSFEIYFNDPSGIVPLREVVLRIPAQTIWGYIGFEQPGQDSLAQLLVDDLLSSRQEDHSFSPGYYSYFSVDESGKVDLRTVEPQSSHYLPVLISAIDKEAANTLIDDFRTENPDFLIEVRDDSGFRY